MKLATRAIMLVSLLLGTSIIPMPNASAVPPTAPTLAGYSPVGGQVQLNITPPAGGADSYQVYESALGGSTWPTDYSRVFQFPTPTYTTTSTQFDVTSGTASNNLLQSSGIVQSIPADSTNSIITRVRFSVSFLNPLVGSCPLNVTIAKADYSLAGTTWDTSKELAGIRQVLTYAGPGGGQNSTQYTFIADFQTGRIIIGPTVDSSQGYQGFFTYTRPQNWTWTGAAGASSNGPVIPNLGANDAYLRVQYPQACNGGVAINADTSGPIAGGAMLIAGTNGVYASTSSDFYKLQVQRAVPGYNSGIVTVTLGCSLSCGQVTNIPRNESGTYHYRVVPYNSDGAGTQSNDASVTVSYSQGINPQNPITRDVWEQLTVASTSQSSNTFTENSGTPIAAGTYLIWVGAASTAVCNGAISLTWTNVFSMEADITDTTPIPVSSADWYEQPIYTLSMATGVSEVIPIQYTSAATDRGFGVIAKITLTSSVTPGSISYSQGNPAGGSGCTFGSSSGPLKLVAINEANTAAHNRARGFVGYSSDHVSGSSSGSTSIDSIWLSGGLGELSEAGILSGCTSCPEATKSPTTSQFSWTQVAGDVNLFTSTTTGGNNAAGQEAMQSFTADPAGKGKYLDTLSMRVQPLTGTCSGASISFSVTGVDMTTGAWNTANELANITATLTKSSGTTAGTVTIDWTNGLISDTTGLMTYSSLQYSIAGSPVSNTNAFSPSFSSATTYYWRVFVTNCANWQTSYTTASQYAGGTAFTRAVGSTGAFTAQAGDIESMTLNVYGGISLLQVRNVTAADFGGAYYVWICEVQRDTVPQQYNFTSNFGGRAKGTGFQAAGGAICSGVPTSSGAQETIQEWRLGYDTIPRTIVGQLTFTLDTSGAGRNQLYVGILTGSQPNHPHIGGPVSFVIGPAYNPILADVIYSTDDYFTQLNFTVFECANSACSAFGNISTIAAYLITICPGGGAFQRQVSGNVDIHGNISITGQDIPGCTVSITLSGVGYSPTVWTNNIANAGTYYFTVGVFFSTVSGGAFSLNPVGVSFYPTDPLCLVTGQNFQTNVTRTRATDLYIGLFKLDSNGVPQLFESPIFYWTANLPNNITFNATHSPVSTSTTGQYVIAVSFLKTNASQFALIAFERVGVNVACNFTVGTSALSTIDSTMQQQITQVNPAASGTPVPTTLTLEQRAAVMLDNMFGSYLFGIPNMVLILLVVVAFGAAMRFHGGGRREE